MLTREEMQFIKAVFSFMKDQDYFSDNKMSELSNKIITKIEQGLK